MTEPPLKELADGVCDESSFIVFLKALAADREDEISNEADGPSNLYGPDKKGWENATIEGFLLAASDWAEASATGLPHYEVPANPWKRCSHIMLMGKLYE